MPITFIGAPLTITVAPSGSWFGPNRLFTTVWPSRQTVAALASSASEIERPSEIFQLRMSI